MKFLAIVAALVSVGACKGKGGAAAAEAVAKMGGFKDSMCACKDKACATKVNDAMNAWASEISKKTGNEKPDPAMAKVMTETATAYGDCMTKVMYAEPTPASPSNQVAEDPSQRAVPFTGPTGIPDCDEYKAAVDKLVACDKMPAATRKVLKESLDQALNGFKSLPADGKGAAGTACRQGLDAIKQAASAVGCQ